MKNEAQMELPELEPIEKSVYDQLVERVGSEETLIYLVLTEYVVRNELAELNAKTILTEYRGRDCIAVRIDKKTSKRVIYDMEIKK